MTDVGSTKGPVTDSVTRSGASSAAIPSAARRRTGPAHANGELFRGATWFLTPVAATDPERYRTLHGFVVSLGAVPVAVDPDAHDRLVALTSHLPHALANLLAEPGGRVAHRRARAARGRRRVAARHDARRGREPAHLGRHLPRQRARRSPPRSRSTGGAWSRSSGRSRTATPASSRAGSPRRRAIAGACSQRRTSSRARCSGCACTSPTVPACSPASRRRSARSGSTSRTSSCTTCRRERGGTLTMLVGRRGGSRARRRDPRGAGLPRRRRARAGRARMTGEDRAGGALAGHIAVPGDKSISHRAVLIGALAEGDTTRPRLRTRPPTRSRRSPLSARSASRSTSPRRTSSSSRASAYAG